MKARGKRRKIREIFQLISSVPGAKDGRQSAAKSRGLESERGWVGVGAADTAKS